jgi:spore coat protein U-like protein
MKKQGFRLVAGMAVAGAMAAAGTWSQSSQAATASANVAVSASVAANCLVSAGTLAFGAYDPLAANDAAPLDASGTFTVRCTRGVTAQVGLDNGLWHSGTRRMRDGASTNYLSYDLYSDSGYATTWDNASNRVSYTAPNKSAQSMTVYGRIPGAQDPAAGSYTDTVAAIAEF